VAYSDVAYNLSRIQCAIPVFEGLLPEPHNKFVMELLFTMAHWHGLAKLRMHNDLTLAVMDAETLSLGVKLREFSQKTCPAFATRELRREYNARLRRSTKKSASRYCQTATSDVCALDATNQTPPSSKAAATPPATGQPQASGQASSGSQPKGAGRRFKTFNLNTYKFHSYGDYVATIRKHGTMDSYSTEPVRGVSEELLYNAQIFDLRASWNIVRLRPDIPERIASSFSSS